MMQSGSPCFMTLRRRVTLWPILLFLLLCAGCGGGHTLVVKPDDGAAVDLMVKDLASARVIFLGEFHDRSAHHRMQLSVIEALQRRGVPLALGLEMFDRESQGALDLWGKGTLSVPDFMAKYRQNWTIDWAEYDRILLFARNKRIPLIGLNVPDDIIGRVAHGGAAALRTSDLDRLPRGVTTAVSDSYRSFLRRAFASHASGMGKDGFDAFCDAQGMRNSTMALDAVSFLERHPERTMVIIAGVGHAMRRAVAAEVARRAPQLTSRIVIPLTEGELPVGVEPEDADYLWAE